MFFYKSYLVSPHPGSSLQSLQDIELITGCTLIPSDNQDLAILVTESLDEASDEKLYKQVKNHPAVSNLALVSVFTDDEQIQEVKS
jgi:hypothetical protein